MKPTIKKVPGSQLEIEIEISPKEFENYFEQATLKLGENLEFEGFRKGMVPKEIIEKKVGKENILVQAADLAVQENYRKAILENKIEAVSEPQIDILKLAQGNPFIFRVKISVLPEIKLPDYKKIASQVKKNKIFEVKEKEIDDTLEWLKKSRAKFSLKNGIAKIGDFVEIEYWLPQIEGLTQPKGQKDSFILGEGHFIPGFEEELFGMKDGEEKKFSLTIPESHHLKNLAGNKIEIKVKVISVQKVEFPEINDQFAKNLGNFEDLNALKNNMKEGLNFEKEQAESRRVRNDILERISQNVDFEIPDFLIEQEQKGMLEELRKNVSENLKIPFNEYLTKIKKTEKEVITSFLPTAQKKVKNLLILREIGKKERIEVSKEEIVDEISKTLKHYPSVEKVEKELDLEKLKLYTEGVIRTEKIFQLLEAFANSR